MRWLLCVALAFLVACGPAPVRDLEEATTPAGPAVPDAEEIVSAPEKTAPVETATKACESLLTEADVEKACGQRVQMEIGITEQQSSGMAVPFYCNRKFDAGDKHAALIVDKYPDQATGQGVWKLMYGKKGGGMTSWEALSIGDGGAKYTQDFGAGTTETVTAIKGTWRVAMTTSTIEGRTAPLCTATQLQQLVELVVGRI